MKKTFGLLGEKLGHSYSPVIHERLGGYEYPLYEISPCDLDAFMTEKKFDGVNVTIPYKQAVMRYCASLSAEANSIGSVNTIIKDKDGLLHGYNTDCHGFRVMLQRGNIDPEGKKILVLGGGGSSKTVIYVLSELGAREIITISRKGENNYTNISRHYDVQIIVNTTPVGMYPGNGESPVHLDEFKQLEGAADLIYNPMRTKLLLDAERLGIPRVNGLAMLVCQAEAASRLFLGMDFSGNDGEAERSQLTDKIINAVISRTRNIALIGMPGCGKSTIGKQLAKTLNRPLADIDELIASCAEKNIPRIFAEDGEETFRGIETRVLGEQAARSGIVIATGGGIVTRPENFNLLRQNSLIIYLKRGLNELTVSGRPLSGSVGIETLAKQRLPLYESWSDCIIDIEANPGLTVKKILNTLE